jgi:hypothetical protein
MDRGEDPVGQQGQMDLGAERIGDACVGGTVLP